MPATDNPSTQPFPSDARLVVRTVRGAFSELLTSAGASPGEPQSISRSLGLNKNLAWKLSKIVQADDPSVVLEQMPGAPGIKIFLRATERAGVSPALVQTARDAIEAYERLLRVHAGDRATLEMLGSVLRPGGHPQRDEQHRKQFFQGASYVWGAQARVMLKVGLVGPGRETGLLDFASLNALVDFRRLRPDVAWIMASRQSSNDDGTQMPTSPWESLDPRFADPGVAPLMGDFCSQPLPELRRHEDEPGSVRFALVEGPVGNTGLLTCVVGVVQRDIPYWRTATNDWGEHQARCDTPAELLIVDLYIHESFAFAIPPEPLLLSQMGIPAPCPKRERNRLPLHERLQDLGTGPLPVATPEVSRYNPMVQAMFDRTGWTPAEFRGFRMRIAYPPCPTSLMLRYRLPERP